MYSAGMKYGMVSTPALSADPSGVANGAVTTRGSNAASLNVENPMVWLVGIGAVTLGLIAASTHIRVGKFEASASAGTP